MRIQTEAIFVRVSPGEKRRIFAAAKRMKMPVAACIRSIVLSHIEAQKAQKNSAMP